MISHYIRAQSTDKGRRQFKKGEQGGRIRWVKVKPLIYLFNQITSKGAKVMCLIKKQVKGINNSKVKN